MTERGVCGCGQPVDERRVARRDASSRFCSSWCEARSAQGKPPQPPPPARPVVVGSPAAVGDGGAGAAAPADAEPTRPRYRLRRRLIADEVEERIASAGMAGTWQAAAALDLADALDWQGGSGSARAALHRQLRDTMDDLLRGVDEPGSRVGTMRDELAARRARRVGGM